MSAAHDRAERLLHETTSLCRVCKNAVPAQVVARGDEVWLHKHCAEHGAQAVQLGDDADWYQRTRAESPAPHPPPRVARPVALGCPFDCGSCPSHQQRTRMPVVTITSQCNLQCPICYVHNRNDGAYHMSRDDFARILAQLVADSPGGEVDLVNLTGGEPFLHPQCLDFLQMAHDAGIHRVSICTNGLALARDEALVRRLAELGARIALSFDTFEREADHTLQGAQLADLKLRCIELLDRHGVDTTLIPVMTRGVNDHEIGRILDFAMQRRCVRHVEVHTMTYTGQGGTHFDRAGRIGLREVLRRIEATTGWLHADDFVPSPVAHPLCYQIAYVLIDPEGGPPVPFLRFMDRATLRSCLGEHLYLEPTPRLEAAMRDAIDRCFAEGGAGHERVLRILKTLLRRLFPSDRALSAADALRVAEQASKAIYVHAHMDEETWDNERIVQCCDANCLADGTQTPVCAYNVLVRDQDPRFNQHPAHRPSPQGGRWLPLVRADRAAP